MTLDAHLVDVISNDLKEALEEPVIFITQTDYVEHMFNSLSALKSALSNQQDMDYTYFMELMTKHHTDWLVAVAEINAVAQNLKANIRDAVSYSITYTINCVKNKPKLLLYVLKSNLGKHEMKYMEPHIKTISKVSHNMETALKDKQHNFKQFTDKQLSEAMGEETEHLLDWLDNMYSNSIVSLCKLLEIWCHDLGMKLHKALVVTSQMIAEFELSRSSNRDRLTEMDYDLLILEQKIKDLHIKLSKNKSDSLTTLALVDLKKELDNQLKLIEVTNKSHMSLKSSASTVVSTNINTLNKMVPVFDHQLPSKQRARLVGQMLKVWKIVFGKRAEADSTISYVSKKNSEITKGLTFFDSDGNVYYYDKNGRYSFDKDMENDLREDVTEKVLVLGEDVLKRLNETFLDGNKYHYDDIGRYYVDNSKQIYKDIDSDNEYEPDEFGNLIRLHHDPEEYYNMSFESTANREDSEYLKNTVGEVLKKCLSKVVMYQPADPIKYLATLLIGYVKLEKEKVEKNESFVGLGGERCEYRFKQQCTPVTTISSLMLLSETYRSDSSSLGFFSQSK